MYQLAEKLSDEIWPTVATGDRFARESIGKQLVRAADSIGANIAEGSGRATFIANEQRTTGDGLRATDG